MSVRRRKPAKLLLPLASMGDIAFLLIIFFMLVSQFMSENFEYDPAASPDVASVEATEIAVVMDRDKRLWVQGHEASVEELAGAVEVLVDNRREQTRVHVKIHKDLVRKDYMPVMEALSEAGVKLVLTGLQSDG